VNEIDLNRNLEEPYEVCQEDKGTFQYADQYQVTSTVILGDEIGQFLDSFGDSISEKKEPLFFQTHKGFIMNYPVFVNPISIPEFPDFLISFQPPKMDGLI